MCPTCGWEKGSAPHGGGMLPDLFWPRAFNILRGYRFCGRGGGVQSLVCPAQVRKLRLEPTSMDLGRRVPTPDVEPTRNVMLSKSHARFNTCPGGTNRYELDGLVMGASTSHARIRGKRWLVTLPLAWPGRILGNCCKRVLSASASV